MGGGAEVNERYARLGLLVLALLGAGGLLYVAIKATGPLPAWQNQPPAAEGRDDPEPDGHCVAAHEHLAGVVFLPHRYPRECGMNVSGVIHHGYSGIRIPEGPDSRWLTSPPSEAMF
jgi:hypothetical protein